MSEQRCGTCKWWTESPSSDRTSSYNQKVNGKKGTCQWPIPVLADSVSFSRVYPKRERAGEQCPVWMEREP